jgi:hypothetical protein
LTVDVAVAAEDGLIAIGSEESAAELRVLAASP